MRLFLSLFGALCLIAGASAGYGYNLHPTWTGTPATRPGNACPPIGYTALAENSGLDRLPPFGKYAICNPNFDTDTEGRDTEFSDFNLTAGIFRLQDSVLLVDDRVQINVKYPAKVDFHNVVIKSFDGCGDDTDTTLCGTQFRSFWRGLRLYGWAHEISATRAPNAPRSVPGDCGRLDNVLLTGFDDIENNINEGPGIGFVNCSAATTVHKVTVLNAEDAFRFEDCRGMVVNDANVGLRSDTQGAGIRVFGSTVYFNRPAVGGGAYMGSVRVESSTYGGGSQVTMCYPTLTNNRQSEVDFGMSRSLVVGPQSSVGIAGANNIRPDHITFLSGGLVYTMKKCPAVFMPSYPTHDWVDLYTPNSEGVRTTTD